MLSRSTRNSPYFHSPVSFAKLIAFGKTLSFAFFTFLGVVIPNQLFNINICSCDCFSNASEPDSLASGNRQCTWVQEAPSLNPQGKWGWGGGEEGRLGFSC